VSSVPISAARVVQVGESRLIFVSGQVSTGPDGHVVGAGDVAAQLAQAYHNLQVTVESVGGTVADIMSLRTYLVRDEDLPAFRLARTELNRSFWGDGPYPTNTLLLVKGLASPDYLVEVEAVAVQTGGSAPDMA